MIIKGTSRGNPKQLAAHLLRSDTNERVQVLELNAPTDDLAETFRDWQALTALTGGRKGLYHANISPGAGYAMTPEQWERAADLLAEKLGLSHQPRTVILHEKEGREHIHVVWQRTDTDTMTLTSDSMNYLAHEQASLALEQEFGHELVPGKHAKRHRELQPEFPRADTTHDEWQQAARTGLDPAERKEQIAALKAASDNAQSFKHALEEAGYILARGERGYTLVDEHGDHFNLARQLKVKIADVTAFMAEVPLDTLPALEEAKARQRDAALTPELHHAEPPHIQAQPPSPPQPDPPTPPDPAPEEPSHTLTAADIAALAQAVNDRQEQEAQKLRNLQAAETNQLRFVLDRDIAEKLAHLNALQQAEHNRKYREMYPEEPGGLAGVIAGLKNRLNPKAAADAKAERDRQWEELLARQRQARMEKVFQLSQGKEQDLNDLHDRHAQKLREHKAQSEKDLERYIREEESARRLLAAEQERQLAEERAPKRDGPEPPGLTR